MWPLRLSAVTPQHSSPCPCCQRLEGLGRGAGLWAYGWIIFHKAKTKPNKTPLFKQKVNNVNETWMDRKLWISLPAQPTSGSKLIHKCSGITKEEQDTHLQPRPSSFPVFLQPQQSSAGMLEQYRKWSALIYIRQCWCSLQITHTRSCKLWVKVSQPQSQHSVIVSAWYFTQQCLKMPTEMFNMKLGKRQRIDHTLTYKISFSFSYSSYAKPQTL